MGRFLAGSLIGVTAAAVLTVVAGGVSSAAGRLLVVDEWTTVAEGVTSDVRPTLGFHDAVGWTQRDPDGTWSAYRTWAPHEGTWVTDGFVMPDRVTVLAGWTALSRFSDWLEESPYPLVTAGRRGVPGQADYWDGWGVQREGFSSGYWAGPERATNDPVTVATRGLDIEAGPRSFMGTAPWLLVFTDGGKVLLQEGRTVWNLPDRQAHVLADGACCVHQPAIAWTYPPPPPPIDLRFDKREWRTWWTAWYSSSDATWIARKITRNIDDEVQFGPLKFTFGPLLSAPGAAAQRTPPDQRTALTTIDNNGIATGSNSAWLAYPAGRPGHHKVRLWRVGSQRTLSIPSRRTPRHISLTNRQVPRGDGTFQIQGAWLAWTTSNGKVHIARTNKKVTKIMKKDVIDGPTTSRVASLTIDGTYGVLDMLINTGTTLTFRQYR